MRRMEKITGRSDDMMIIRGVNVFPTQIEEHILKDQALAPHYQIVLTREDRLDAMEILIEAAETTTEADRTSSATALQQRLKGSIGLSCSVTVTPPLGIERSQGKARRVIDRRPKE
jgi:phenylacetate-CoA ligase